MEIEPINPRGVDLYLDYTHSEGILCYQLYGAVETRNDGEAQGPGSRARNT